MQKFRFLAVKCQNVLHRELLEAAPWTSAALVVESSFDVPTQKCRAVEAVKSIVVCFY